MNILTCRIKAMRKLVTKHVTNGAITQRPEMKGHVFHKNSRDTACLRAEVEAWTRLNQGMDDWINHHPVDQSTSLTDLNFFEEGMSNYRKKHSCIVKTTEKNLARGAIGKN